MRSLYLAFVYLTFFVTGAAAPFALTLGYLWVNVFRPQEVSYTLLNSLPISMMTAVAAVGSYLLLDRRYPPRPNLVMILTLCLAFWVTLTTIFFAVVPEVAWRKWDWAFKTLLFSVFLQFTIRSRVQIEAFLQVYVLGIAANFIPVGIKTLISGGGYGQTLSLGGDSIIGESSTLATVSIMTIPILLCLRNHTLLLPERWIKDPLYLGLVFLAVIAAIGTYARTAVIGFIVVGIAIWIQTQRKIFYGFIAAIAAISVVFFTSDEWNERISTIDDYQSEGSALGRILVWRWTLQFVAENPFGGGFESYLINLITFPDGQQARGKAFHSIYFELLGEHGWPGLIIFLSICIAIIFQQRVIIRSTKGDFDMAWSRDLAKALQTSLATLMVCGAFIGIAFLPMFYFIFAISTALRLHVLRVQRDVPAVRWTRDTPSRIPSTRQPRSS